MKIAINKPFLPILLSAFLLSACAGSPADLQGNERALYDLNQEAGAKAAELAQEMEMPEGQAPDYKKMWDKSREVEDALESISTRMKELSFPEEFAQSGENATAILEQTLRIVAKVGELTAEAENSTDLEQIKVSLDGFKGRLEQSSKKFDDLNTELTKPREQ